MYRLDRFKRKRNYLFSLFPFAKVCEVDKKWTLILNKDGSIQTTWSYREPDLDSAIKEQLGVITAQINAAFQSLGNEFVLYFEVQRHSSTQYATDVYFPDEVTKAIDEERKQMFEGGSYYESDYYMTMYWMPPSDNEGKLKKLVVEGEEKNEYEAQDHIGKFVEMADKLFRVLQELRIPVEHMSANGIITYLHSIISGKNYPIRLPDHPVFLDSFLADESFIGGLMPRIGNQYVAVVVPLSFPSISQFGLFDALNRLDFAYRWNVRFFCLDKAESLSALRGVKRGWNGKIKSFGTRIKELFTGVPDNYAINESVSVKVNEVREALTSVEEDEVFYGFYSSAVVILDENLERLKEKAKRVEQIFSNIGMKAKTEDLNAVDAWLSTIPGNICHQVRHPLISTGNLVHMMPLSDIWAGPDRNKHLDGPCLIYTRTEGNTPFRLNFHIGEVGHTFLIGTTGAGKSVHLNMICAQFRKYKDAQVIIFDKGASSRVLTEAVGGIFYDIGNERTGLSFQPLSQIDDEKERTWAIEWILDFLAEENVASTPEIRQALWDALDLLASMPVKYRTFSSLIPKVQNDLLRQALNPLALGGSYGSIFDSDHDNLKFSSWQSFEMEKLSDNKRIMVPTLMYLFHRIEQLIKNRQGRGVTLVEIDECWTHLKNPLFAKKIEEWLKELRKYNAFVIFATQSLDEVIKSPIFPTILESCQSRIFLPNNKATEKTRMEHYTSFGLNEKQIQIIANATPQRHYYYTSPLGARLYDLALGRVALAYVAPSKADLEECQRIIDEYGHEQFVEMWEKYKGLDKEEN